MEDGKRGILLELDFGDADLVVRLHPDGMYTIDIPEPRLLLNEEQYVKVLKGFAFLAQCLTTEPLLEALEAQYRASVQSETKCSHKFVHSKVCLKCGWQPDGGQTTPASDLERRVQAGELLSDRENDQLQAARKADTTCGRADA